MATYLVVVNKMYYPFVEEFDSLAEAKAYAEREANDDDAGDDRNIYVAEVIESIDVEGKPYDSKEDDDSDDN